MKTTDVIYNNDCLEGMKQLEDESIDFILTDPPYTTPTCHAFGRQKINRLSDLAIQEHYFSAIKIEWERILKQNAPIMVFCDDVYAAVLMGLFYDWQQKNIVVWDKGRIGMGNPFRKQHEFIFYANRGSLRLNQEELTHIPTVLRVPNTKQYHGAEKPLSLLETLIKGLTRKGDLVLDCFIGSGSTGVAAVNTDRHYLGFELDPGYYSVALTRLEKVKAEKGALQ